MKTRPSRNQQRLAALERRILALEGAVFKIRGRAVPPPDSSPLDAILEFVLRLVSSRYHVPIPVIVGRSRRECFTWPRHVALWLMRRCTSHTLDSIGRLLDGRDHKTVMLSGSRVEDRMSIDPEFAALVRELEQQTMAALKAKLRVNPCLYD